jgi:hypothetical protein
MDKEQIAVLSVMAILFGFSFCWNISAKASTLSLEPPPPPALYMNGTQVNLTADDKDRDLSINPIDDLPANGTQKMSTNFATDVDINVFPPKGVTVLIQNDSVTVTNHTVDVSTDLDEEIAQQAVESNDDGDNSDGDSDGGDE